MIEQEDIRRGSLSGKMERFNPEPPDSVWEGISGRIGRKDSNRRMFIILAAAAAGIALAVTVGIKLINPAGQIQKTDLVSEANTGISKEEPGDPVQGENEELYTSESSGKANVHPGSGESVVGRLKPSLEDRVIAVLNEINEDEKEKNPLVAKLEAPAEALPGLLPAEDQEEIYSDSSGTGNISLPVSETDNEDRLLQLLVGEDEIIPEHDQKARKGRWNLGAAVSPQLSYRDVASMDQLQNKEVNDSESAKFTYSGGVKISYVSEGRLTFESGIFYNKMGVNIGDYSNFKNSIFSQNEMSWFDGLNDITSATGNVVGISNSMGTVVSNTNDVFVNKYSGAEPVADYHMMRTEELNVGDAPVEGFTQSFEYLEIPFNVKYSIIDRDFKVQVIGGISTNLLVNNSFLAATETGLVEIGTVNDVKSVNYSGTAGLGFVYALAEKFSISLEPRFRYYLNSINNYTLPATRPFVFGIQTGINYTF